MGTSAATIRGGRVPPCIRRTGMVDTRLRRDLSGKRLAPPLGEFFDTASISEDGPMPSERGAIVLPAGSSALAARGPLRRAARCREPSPVARVCWRVVARCPAPCSASESALRGALRGLAGPDLAPQGTLVWGQFGAVLSCRQSLGEWAVSPPAAAAPAFRERCRWPWSAQRRRPRSARSAP